MNTLIPRTSGWSAVEMDYCTAGSIPFIKVSGLVQTAKEGEGVYLDEVVLPEVGTDTLVLCLKGSHCAIDEKTAVLRAVKFKKVEKHRKYNKVVILWNGTTIHSLGIARPL